MGCADALKDQEALRKTLQTSKKVVFFGVALSVASMFGMLYIADGAVLRMLANAAKDREKWRLEHTKCKVPFDGVVAVFPILTTDARRHSAESKARLVRTVSQLAELELPSFPIETKFENGKLARPSSIRSALQMCESLHHKYDFCLILEDGIVLHPNLLSELRCTTEDLPSQWRLLHLCPGTQATYLENNLLELEGTRVFQDWPAIAFQKSLLVAFLLKSEKASEMLRLVPQFGGYGQNEMDFVAKQPQLCYEAPFFIALPDAYIMAATSLLFGVAVSFLSTYFYYHMRGKNLYTLLGNFDYREHSIDGDSDSEDQTHSGIDPYFNQGVRSSLQIRPNRRGG